MERTYANTYKKNKGYINILQPLIAPPYNHILTLNFTAMKTKETIEAATNSIMEVVNRYIAEGRTYGTFRWIKEHQLLGNVQKESRHELLNIRREFIESNVRDLNDYHIV